MSTYSQQAHLVALWAGVKTGTEIVVRMDNGTVLCTRTQSSPWLSSSGRATIQVQGIRGHAQLSCVSLAGPVSISIAPTNSDVAIRAREVLPARWRPSDVVAAVMIVSVATVITGNGLAALFVALGLI